MPHFAEPKRRTSAPQIRSFRDVGRDVYRKMRLGMRVNDTSAGLNIALKYRCRCRRRPQTHMHRVRLVFATRRDLFREINNSVEYQRFSERINAGKAAVINPARVWGICRVEALPDIHPEVILFR